jgi:hypothetical protein
MGKISLEIYKKMLLNKKKIQNFEYFVFENCKNCRYYNIIDKKRNFCVLWNKSITLDINKKKCKFWK